MVSGNRCWRTCCRGPIPCRDLKSQQLHLARVVACKQVTQRHRRAACCKLLLQLVAAAAAAGLAGALGGAQCRRCCCCCWVLTQQCCQQLLPKGVRYTCRRQSSTHQQARRVGCARRGGLCRNDVAQVVKATFSPRPLPACNSFWGTARASRDAARSYD